MQTKQVNQNCSHESLTVSDCKWQISVNAGTLFNTSDYLPVWKIPDGNERSHSLHQVHQLRFIFPLYSKYNAKSPPGVELSGKTTYIAWLHGALNNSVRKVSSH